MLFSFRNCLEIWDRFRLSFLETSSTTLGIEYTTYSLYLGMAGLSSTIVSGTVLERMNFRTFIPYSFFNTITFCVAASKYIIQAKDTIIETNEGSLSWQDPQLCYISMLLVWTTLKGHHDEKVKDTSVCGYWIFKNYTYLSPTKNNNVIYGSWTRFFRIREILLYKNSAAICSTLRSSPVRSHVILVISGSVDSFEADMN